MTVPQAFQTALAHHQAGRQAEAEALYRQILAVEPGHADTLHLLGVIAHQVGRNDVAVELIGKAVAISPGEAAYHSNLGLALGKLGRRGEAVASHRRAVELKADFAEAHSNLGNELRRLGHLDEAVAECRRAIELKPDYAVALNNLGVALSDQRKPGEAAAAFRGTLRLVPEFAEAHNNLGNALVALGSLDEAVTAFRDALRLQPENADAHNNLGTALGRLGRHDEALAAYRRALELRPDFAEAWSNSAFVLKDQGRLDEAEEACRRSIRIKPDHLNAFRNLGTILKQQGKMDEAIAAYRHALQREPDDAAMRNNLGNALGGQGLIEDAICEFRRALELLPDFGEVRSNLLLMLHYRTGADPAEIFAEHRRWDAIRAQPLAKHIAPHGNERTPDRRLRIGYVSPDFREHSAAFFLEGLLATHDSSQVEVFCYADSAKEDEFTVRFRAAAAHWRKITAASDEAVAQMIRTDEIDILVDLAGHTGHNRLLVFARKPAPVQATYLGYPDTTGMDAMDFRLTDEHADPPGMTEHLHSEELVRLRDGAWCYRPAAEALPVGALPAAQAGRITFGSFNATAKINAEMLALWARLLAKVPGSRLVLKGMGLGDNSVRGRVLGILQEEGIGPERVDLLGWTRTAAEHLGSYGTVDIALDTHPYAGTATTCEALWMGVPVVTLAGSTHVSRVGVSLLKSAGLPELIAASADEYVEIAAKLAADLPRLAELRATLRERMRGSVLTDAPRFARNMEDAFRKMWRAWCADDRREMRA